MVLLFAAAGQGCPARCGVV